MARMARVVIPIYPHHVTQRGNRRQRTFFGDADYSTYLAPISEFSRAEQISAHSRTGRLLGGAMFVRTLGRITGRVLTCRPPGRKRKAGEK